jgi:ATP-binding cassette subfamily B protein
VGASGAGKSTLINLLMGLYEVDDGRILVDGTDMSEIRSSCYHSQIGVVLQETFLFSGTILDNIRFSKPDATLEEIIMAAKMANAHDFICDTPGGYNTYVGEKGYSLSGGERQRIAIARAILTDPRILILDEATASLDTESEFMIQKALERLTSGKTTFAIAHRLSTLKNADRIMVIDKHRIAEIGSHEELMEKKGIYYSLQMAQSA